MEYFIHNFVWGYATEKKIDAAGQMGFHHQSNKYKR